MTPARLRDNSFKKKIQLLPNLCGPMEGAGPDGPFPIQLRLGESDLQPLSEAYLAANF